MAAAYAQQQQPSVFPKSHVGFDSITSQIEKKLLKRGFQFNVICVGTYDYYEIRKDPFVLKANWLHVQVRLGSESRL